MIAPPPGWGSRTTRTWWFGILAYLVALPAGALIFGISLHLLADAFGHPPLWVVGIVALASAAVGGGIVPIRILGRGWRIPQTRARFGHVAYAALFGGILGVGFLTAVPSIGFYAFVAWGLAAPGWESVVLVFGAFGVGRSVPLLSSALNSKKRGEYPDEELDRFDDLALKAFFVELFLLSLVGSALLLWGVL